VIQVTADTEPKAYSELSWEDPVDRLYNVSPKTEDQRIYDAVCQQLTSQADIESREIVVEVKNSVVVLTGRVENCLERQEAETAAHAVYGVSLIRNDIRIESKSPPADSEIKETILACLRMSICILEELPSVSVCNGIVTLKGQARWMFQAINAERTAEAVAGVKWVRNLIDVVFETTRPCRQMSHHRVNNTPSSINRTGPEPVSDCRPLFFVPSVIARA